MTRRVSYLLLALCVCLPTLVFAADWPQWRGPNVDGIAPEKGINKNWAVKMPATLWQIPLSDNGFAGPSVAEGKVFIIDHVGDRDIVRALELQSGKEVWNFAYDDAAKDNYGFTRATPVYDQGRLYILSWLGMAYCLNAKTGAQVWTRNIIHDFNGVLPTWNLAMSPLIDGNKVILCPGGANAAVVALNKNTGETIWQGGGSDKPGYATPVTATILGVKQYVIFTGVSLIGVKIADGALLWRYPWQTKYDINAATPIVNGSSIFISSGYDSGSALLDITKDGPVKRWESRAMRAHFNTPVCYHGFLYGASDPEGDLICMNPTNGAVLWRQHGFEKGGVVVADDVLFALCGNSGELVMLRPTPEGYQELGRCKPLGGQSWTPPIIADGKMIVRNRKALACLNIR